MPELDAGRTSAQNTTVKQTILYFYLKTGGGHFFSAKALSAAVGTDFPDTVNLPTDGIPPNVKKRRAFLEDGYRIAVQDLPFMWPLLYEFSRIRPIRFLQLLSISWMSGKYIREEILRTGATKIVVLHFLLVRPVMKAVKKLGLPIHVLEVVTDPFTVHPFWFHHRNVPAAVFSERAKSDAVKKFGWNPEMIHVYPIMLRPEFENPVPAKDLPALKKKYGLDPTIPIVLLAGGGDGLPGAEKVIHEADLAGLKAQIILVCGKNEKQKADVEEFALSRPPEALPMKVFGFVDFMYDLMNIADIIVTKGGPATIMEILMLGKPPLVVNYIYGQEQGNVDFIQENGVGAYIPQPSKLAQKLVELAHAPEHLQVMKDRIKNLGLRNGTGELARWVHDFPVEK